MSEGTCNFCGVWSRNACDSREEASTCPNNSNRGSCLDFKAADVAEWIRFNCYDDADLLAADLIEKKM